MGCDFKNLEKKPVTDMVKKTRGKCFLKNLHARSVPFDMVLSPMYTIKNFGDRPKNLL